MRTTHHSVDFAYTPQELQALLRNAHAYDVEHAGCNDTRRATITIWSHRWTHPATREASATIGTFDGHWEPRRLYEIATDEGFGVEDLMQALGQVKGVGDTAVNRLFPNITRY